MNVQTSVTLACMLEATARKAGNVHPNRDFADLCYHDLLVAGCTVAPILANARDSGVARSALDAVIATRAAVQTNANLGIILLLAPLCSVEPQSLCPHVMSEVVASLDVNDTCLVYEAIRIAQPGGLDRVPDQDVSDGPTFRLADAMRLAAGRDTIARQFCNGFADVFELGVPALVDATQAGASLEEAIVWCHLTWMARFPDSLIWRKLGEHAAHQSAEMAAAVLKRCSTAAGTPAPGFLDDDEYERLDRQLDSTGHRWNPGTSADLVTASLYCALRTDRIELRTMPFCR